MIDLNHTRTGDQVRDYAYKLAAQGLFVMNQLPSIQLIFTNQRALNNIIAYDDTSSLQFVNTFIAAGCYKHRNLLEIFFECLTTDAMCQMSPKSKKQTVSTSEQKKLCV